MPLRPRRDVLADFRTVLQGVYDPTAYFARVRWLVANLGTALVLFAILLAHALLRNRWLATAAMIVVFGALAVDRGDLQLAAVEEEAIEAPGRAHFERATAADFPDSVDERQSRLYVELSNATTIGAVAVLMASARARSPVAMSGTTATAGALPGAASNNAAARAGRP